MDRPLLLALALSGLALLAVALLPRALPAAEATTEWEGGPKITHVRMMKSIPDQEWWAWVTIEHEDWPIESRIFVLPEYITHPLIPDRPYEERREERLATRPRRLVHPYSHFVNWWVVEGPKGEKLHRRNIEQPHPGGWPFTMLEKGIKIPLGITQVTFRAHDKLHGYGPKTVTVDILKPRGPDYEVEQLPLPPYTGRQPGVRRWMRSSLAAELKHLNW